MTLRWGSDFLQRILYERALRLAAEIQQQQPEAVTPTPEEQPVERVIQYRSPMKCRRYWSTPQCAPLEPIWSTLA